MANTSIELVGLDFQNIKTNLKTYLKNNTSLKDADFEGSNLNVLIDLLSYNTYLNSFYTNMVASEMFIDTAQLRDSIISHAKSLNYTPRSFVSSVAEVNISITPSSEATSVVIPKGTTFTSRMGSNSYTFSTAENIILTSASNGVFSSTISLYEGVYVADSFVMNRSNTSQRFVLSNPTVDTKSLFVTVVEDNGLTSEAFTQSETLIGIGSSSNVYFVEAAENQQFEIKFGDDVFGRKPKDGAVLVAEYRVSSGELPNGASSFINDGNIDGHSNISITTVSSAAGGSVAETIESIRYNAPRNFQSQGRAVTATDYEILLKSNFSDIENISAYGGEELTPAEFGKVFISVDVQNADGVPQNRVTAYKDFLKDKTPVSIQTVFINPEFMYVDVETTVKYNVNKTSKLSNDIKSSVLSAISNFNNTSLNGFKKTLYYSQFLRAIDAADPSIVSNETSIKAIKMFVPTINAPTSYQLDFGFEIESETGVVLASSEYHYGHGITSSPFTSGGKRCIMFDDSRGKLYLGTLTGSVVDLVKTIGTVDYTTGVIVITDLEVTDYDGSGIKVYARSVTKDFSGFKNVILTIQDEDVNVTIIPVKV